MAGNSLFLGEKAYRRLIQQLCRIRSELGADLALLISKAGQQVAAEGLSGELDMTALSSLAAANLAATDGLAQIVGEESFSALHHQGRGRSIHISEVAGDFVTVVVMSRPLPAGMVRWKVRRAAAAMTAILREGQAAPSENRDSKQDAGSSGGQFRITDEELDRLFSPAVADAIFRGGVKP